ncbi:peptidylprolyl isomerase [Isosphaeraceae bacterium EP7]
MFATAQTRHFRRMAALSLALTSAVGTSHGQVAPKAQAQAQADASKVRVGVKAIPVNPGDAIATINGEPITRQQLADEAVARKGTEILETMIARKLIDQAIKAHKLDVTADEINQEIENTAQRMAGVTREAWLRSLEKERGISPVMYARDVIYPALALRKLATPRVQVTEKEIDSAFDASYGAKVRCRIIMVTKLREAQEIWEQLKKNPAGFEKIAQERSTDSATRSLGGLLAEPISRHAYPLGVSTAVYRQLYDGDPEDKDPAHKPKDGDFTGPVQVEESSWVILQRVSVIDAQPQVRTNPAIRAQLKDVVFEAKLKDAMSNVFMEVMDAAAIENQLTGSTKLAHEGKHAESRVDGDVKLMSNPPAAANSAPKGTAPGTPGRATGKMASPVGLSEADQKRFAVPNKPKATGTIPVPVPAAASAPAKP